LELPSQLAASNARILNGLRAGLYDFLDLGTNNGGGFKIGERLGGTKGVGLDLNPGMVQWNLDRGRDVMCQDVRALPAGINGIRFAVLSNVLEHLPSIYDVGSVISALVPVCGEYLLIYGPNFDTEEFLYQHNLKLIHTAMRDHLCRFKTIDLIKVLFDLNLRDFVIGARGVVHDSNNPFMHRADAPADGLWTWEEGKSLPKPFIRFNRPLYTFFICVVKLSPKPNCDDVLKNFSWGCDRVIFRSHDRFTS